MGKQNIFLRSQVKSAEKIIAKKPRSLDGISANNIINKQRSRRRARSYLPGAPCTFEKLGFDDGTEHRVLDPGGQYIHKAYVVYTGSRSDDFHIANSAVGLKATPAGHVWHHYHDYHSPTVGGVRQVGGGTLYLMRIEDHKKHHYGGCEQYRLVHGNGY